MSASEKTGGGGDGRRDVGTAGAAPTDLPEEDGSTGGDGSAGDDGAAGDDLAALLRSRRVVVCCGPGGVGKTTVSATFALAAARAGRKACVVTVDPARRLADALGVESLANVPARVDGDWPGELHAVMLDARGTFDDLVARYARTPEQAESIRSNRLYQSLAGALSGTQEYMALEKLYELTEEGGYDVVVVDTPPTRNALDLLDAPRRLTHFLENRLFRALMVPTRAYLRAVNFATQALLRTIAKVAGADIVHDAVAFFQAFEGMEQGFHDRASAVRALLGDPATAYVVVTSPRPDAVEEASYFADKLVETGLRPAGLVVNRVHPHFGQGLAPFPTPPDGSDLAVHLAVLDELELQANLEEAAFADLARRVRPAPVGLVPLLGTDVHDVYGLVAVAAHLFTDRSPDDAPGDGGGEGETGEGAGASGHDGDGGVDAPGDGREEGAGGVRDVG